MKSDFLIAITQLAAEKNLPREVVLKAVEAALASAYKKDNLAGQNLSVRILPTTGEVKVYTQKTVVEEPADARREVALAEARRVKKGIQLGETIEVETTPHHAGRIAAQTAKQVVLQRLREAEREVVFEEYADKEGDIVSGVVQRIEPKQIIIDLGKTETILAPAEQVRTERYRVGQRLKLYLIEVYRTSKGPQLLVSRSHRNLLRRLFELEVPEIHNGVVELKAIAREAGYRSKVAVAAQQEGVDPVGSCVGLRGIRIQNIVNELNGERIDVVQWHSDPKVYISNALSPAQVLSVEVNEEEKAATVVVPDRQLSLAIGKEGQNARLAAKLTGWRIDIKSASAAEAERAALEAEKAAEQAAALVEEAVPELVESPASVSEEISELPPPEQIDPEVPVEPTLPPLTEEKLAEPELLPELPRVRFAEEIVLPEPVKPGAKPRKGKKQREAWEQKEKEKELVAAARPKKGRKTPKPIVDEEEDEEYEYLKKMRR